jgi:tRNA dimethylallyltransferase
MAGIWLPRSVLAARIVERVLGMRDAGFLEEVTALHRSPGLGRTAAQAIGYRELADHLEGRGTLEEAYATTIRRTRSFARRQRMWFRRDPRITWLGAAAKPCALEPALLALWGS